MSDMTAVIAPKSDQINADDLIAGDITITITGVKVSPGQEQPVSIEFAGSPKVFRPCKSMSRVMVAAWGPDAKAYVGKSLSLYRDPRVKWGGMEVGGIRIRAMSHIERDLTMMLSESKANRKPFRVALLQAQAQQQASSGMSPLSPADALRLAEAAANRGTDHFRAWFNSPEGKDCRATNALTPEEMTRLKVVCSRADNPPDETDPFGLPPLDRTTTATELTDAMQTEAMERAQREADEQARLAGAA